MPGAEKILRRQRTDRIVVLAYHAARNPGIPDGHQRNHPCSIPGAGGQHLLGGAVGIGVPEAGDDPVAAPTPQNFPQLPAAVDQQVPIVGAGVIGNTLRELFQMPCQSEQNCFTLLFHEDRDPGYTVFVVSVIVFQLSLYYTRKKRLCQYGF